MKKTHPLLLACLFSFLALTGFATEAPAGVNGLWVWTANGPQGPIEVKARLENKDGVVTGVIMARDTETAIQPGTFKDDRVAFIVIREMHDLKLEVKYSGKVSGDTITGTIDRPLPGGERQVVEWKAARTK